MGFFLYLLLSLVPAAAQSADRNTDPHGRVMVPEIMALEDGAEIPAELFDRYDTRTLGESIAARVERGQWSTPKFHPWNSAESGHVGTMPLPHPGSLQLYFNPERLPKITTNGFLNAFQVVDGEKLPGYRQRRDLTELTLSGLRLEKSPSLDKITPANTLRPKSVVFDFPLPKDSTFSVDGAHRFGGAVAVFKAEVAKRTTITPFDSMAIIGGDPEQVTLNRKTLVTTPFANHVSRPQILTEYFEGQIWGALDLRDLQEWWLPEGSPPKLVEEFRATGLPLYEYVEDLTKKQYRRVRGARISEGDPEKMAAMSKSLEGTYKRPPPSAKIPFNRESKLAERLRAGKSLREALAVASESERNVVVELYAKEGDPAAIKLFLKRHSQNPIALLARLESPTHELPPQLLEHPGVRRLIEKALRQAIGENKSNERVISVAAGKFGESGDTSASFRSWVLSRVNPEVEESYRLLAWLNLNASDDLERVVEMLSLSQKVDPYDWLQTIPRNFRSAKITDGILSALKLDPEGNERNVREALAKADIHSPGFREKLVEFSEQNPNLAEFIDTLAPKKMPIPKCEVGFALLLEY